MNKLLIKISKPQEALGFAKFPIGLDRPLFNSIHLFRIYLHLPFQVPLKGKRWCMKPALPHFDTEVVMKELLENLVDVLLMNLEI